MKKSILFSIAFLFICTFSFAAKGYEVKFSQPQSTEYQLTFQVTDWNLENVKFDGVEYQQIIFSSSAVTQEKGWAELPFISASIQLPARKNVDLSIVYTEFADYQLNAPLVPSRGTIMRNQDPSTIPYVIDPASIMDKFYPSRLAYSEEPYIIRDVRGASVRVFPFQYNAATNTLRVYSKVEVLLTENNEPATNPLLVENPNPIREVRGMYKSLFINYSEPKIPLFMADHGDILVITTARDETAIQPYIDWKKEKGYNITKEVVATGTNVKTLIKDKYTANNNLMYVLLVGGWNDIKSDTYTSAPTDPMLGIVVGNPTAYRPDISIGRMAANNAAQVTVQVNKTIQYEKNPDMGNWYSSFIGMGSNDGSGGDDGEKDWLHIQRIYSERLEPTYNYNQHYRLYENESGCTASNLATYINTGASTIAYCGHGSETSFVTTGFSNTNVNQLTNGVKLPFIVSVACVNGAFHNSSDCFAEAWLKKENGGAVITWMSTINQPWNPPMRGEDYFYDILIGGFNYNNYSGQNGINTNELRTHWGAIAVNAANLMLSEVSNSDDIETVRTWCTFGDPSLQLRTKQPAVLASSSSLILVGTPYTTTITANGNAVIDALVCISQNGVYKSAFTDEAGYVSIDNEFTPGEVRLVVTAFNTNTIYDNITCVAPEGPYIICGGYSVVETENLTYTSTNEEIAVTLKNVGVAPTTGPLTVTITCDDPQLTINNGTTPYTGTIAPDGTAEVNFTVTVANNIIDGKAFPLDVTVTTESKAIFESKLSLKAYAPNFSLSKVLVDGVENGNMKKGALVKLTAVIENKGGADAYGVISNLEIDDEYVFIACDDVKNRESKNLIAGESMSFDFFVITSPDMPSGYEANFDFSLEAQYGRTFSKEFTVACSGSGNYCSSGSQNCTDGDKFTLVQLFKTSEPNQLLINNNTSSICSSNGYEDFTNISFNLETGVQYTIKVKVGFGTQTVKGWFDLNGDNNFDNENLFTISCGSADTEYSQTFTVPATNIEPGAHRFRLVCKYSGTPTPCNNSSYGQTQDYTFILPEMYPRVQNVVATLADETINISWDTPEEGTPLGYNIYRNGNKLNASLLTDLSFTEENITEGIYAYNVTAVYTGDKESYAKMSNIICYFLPCEPPVNFEGTLEGKTAVLTWDPPVNINGVLTGYNIYRDETVIHENSLSELQYNDENLPIGTYNYQVSAVYEDCESELSDAITLTIEPEFCEPPVNLQGTIEEDLFVLTWDRPENMDGSLLRFDVYRDGDKVSETFFSVYKYIEEELLTEGAYLYQVKAIYNHCVSDFSESYELIIANIKEVNAGAIQIFPNPTTGELRIDNGELKIKNVEIYDVYGRIIVIPNEAQRNEESITINISRFPAGIYFLKINTVNETITKKIIKI